MITVSCQKKVVILLLLLVFFFSPYIFADDSQNSYSSSNSSSSGFWSGFSSYISSGTKWMGSCIYNRNGGSLINNAVTRNIFFSPTSYTRNALTPNAANFVSKNVWHTGRPFFSPGTYSGMIYNRAGNSVINNSFTRGVTGIGGISYFQKATGLTFTGFGSNNTWNNSFLGKTGNIVYSPVSAISGWTGKNILHSDKAWREKGTISRFIFGQHSADYAKYKQENPDTSLADLAYSQRPFRGLGTISGFLFGPKQEYLREYTEDTKKPLSELSYWSQPWRGWGTISGFVLGTSPTIVEDYKAHNPNSSIADMPYYAKPWRAIGTLSAHLFNPSKEALNDWTVHYGETIKPWFGGRRYFESELGQSYIAKGRVGGWTLTGWLTNDLWHRGVPEETKQMLVNKHLSSEAWQQAGTSLGYDDWKAAQLSKPEVQNAFAQAGAISIFVPKKGEVVVTDEKLKSNTAVDYYPLGNYSSENKFTGTIKGAFVKMTQYTENASVKTQDIKKHTFETIVYHDDLKNHTGTVEQIAPGVYTSANHVFSSDKDTQRVFLNSGALVRVDTEEDRRNGLTLFSESNDSNSSRIRLETINRDKNNDFVVFTVPESYQPEKGKPIPVIPIAESQVNIGDKLYFYSRPQIHGEHSFTANGLTATVARTGYNLPGLTLGDHTEAPFQCTDLQVRPGQSGSGVYKIDSNGHTVMVGVLSEGHPEQQIEPGFWSGSAIFSSAATALNLTNAISNHYSLNKVQNQDNIGHQINSQPSIAILEQLFVQNK